jgi:hypothetical protein
MRDRQLQISFDQLITFDRAVEKLPNETSTHYIQPDRAKKDLL